MSHPVPTLIAALAIFLSLGISNASAQSGPNSHSFGPTIMDNQASGTSPQILPIDAIEVSLDDNGDGTGQLTITGPGGQGGGEGPFPIPVEIEDSSSHLAAEVRFSIDGALHCTLRIFPSGKLQMYCYGGGIFVRWASGDVQGFVNDQYDFLARHFHLPF